MAAFPMSRRDTVSALAVACLLEDATVDQGKRFIPEEFSPLFYTPSYQALTEEQRLRYNQLQRSTLTSRSYFSKRPSDERCWKPYCAIRCHRNLQKGCASFWRRSSSTQKCSANKSALRAAILWSVSFLFYSATALMDGGPKLGYTAPSFLPHVSLLMLLQEERSLFYSRRVIAQRDELEPHFVKIHRSTWPMKWGTCAGMKN